MRLLFRFGLLQGCDLRLGQDQALLRDLGLQRLEAFLHRLEIMALPDAAHAGRGDRIAEFPHFVGDANLAEGRLLQRKRNDPRLDRGRGPVRQDRLLAGDFLASERGLQEGPRCSRKPWSSAYLIANWLENPHRRRLIFRDAGANQSACRPRQALPRRGTVQRRANARGAPRPDVSLKIPIFKRQFPF